MVNKYHKNNLVRLKSYFMANNVLTDPTTITLKVKNPAGTTSTYTYGNAEVYKESTGIYYKDIIPDIVGNWYYDFAGAGALVAEDEHNFIVDASQF